eukprot:382008-Amphidinium_carterae.2
MMLLNSDMRKVIELQKIKDKAIQKQLELELANKPLGVDESEDQFHSAKHLEDCAFDLLSLLGASRWRHRQVLNR